MGQQRYVHRGRVLQEDGVRRRCQSGRQHEENDGRSVGKSGADLRPRPVEVRTADYERDQYGGNSAARTGNCERVPVDRLDEQSAQTPQDRSKEKQDNRFSA